MAAYAGPEIVEDGLILLLDAGNQRSYSGSGNNFYNLAASDKTATLSNAPTFANEVGGCFQLNGALSQTIILGNGNTFFPLNEWTLEIAFRCNEITSPNTSAGLIGITYGWRTFITTNGIQVGLHNGTTLIYHRVNEGTSYIDSNWHYFLWSNDGIDSKFCLDGNLYGPLAQEWNGSTIWPTNGAHLGRDMNNSTYYMTGAISFFRLHNRVLSDDEAYKNFNATRSRFGI